MRWPISLRPFDLGVLVVASRAMDAPTRSGDASSLTVRKAAEKPLKYLKIKLTDVLISGYAIDRSSAAKAGWELKHGKVIAVAGAPVCQLSSTPLTK